MDGICVRCKGEAEKIVLRVVGVLGAGQRLPPPRLSHSPEPGLAGGGSRAAVRPGFEFPEHIDDRDQFAYNLVPRALTEIS